MVPYGTKHLQNPKSVDHKMTDSNQRSVIPLFIELNRLISQPEVSTDSVKKFLEENGLTREAYVENYVIPSLPYPPYPPIVALEKENFEKLDVLLSHGYQLQDSQVTATDDILANTCRDGKYEVVKTLVEKYNVNVNVSGKWIPLYEAMEECNIDIVEYLIEKGVHVDAVDDRGRNVLHIAGDRFLLPFRRKDLPFSVFEKLVLRGADVNQRDVDGKTPLHYAANAHVGVVHACIKAGADVKATCIIEGQSKTALDVASEGYRYLLRSRSRDEEKAFQHIILSLIHAGSDVTGKHLLYLLTLTGNFQKSTFGSFRQKLYRWTNELESKPRSLRDLCIFKIRSELSGRLLSVAGQLPVPPKIQAMLRLEHVIPNEFEVVN